MAISSLSWGNLLALAIVSLILYTLSYAIYNLYFHPLARFPGPLLMRATKAGFCYPLIKGTLPFDVLGLHKKYGPVVRIAPDQLIFGDPQAWKDVMGHRVGGGPELEKSLKFYKPLEEIPVDIVNASREEHGQLRRTMAHGFSDRSMREQQPIIKGYIDLLIRRLRQNCGDGNKKLNINAWYNFTTFDIIGDLAFGESFGCLDNSDYHPWVRAIFQLARVGTVMQSAAQYPALMKLILTLIPKKAMQERKHHIDLTKAKLQRRMEVGKERPDLVEGLLRKKDELGLTLDKLQANSAILIIGGSETTATLLSGVTFLLLTNPDALAKLKSEIRSSFKSQHEIDFASVSALPYLLACLDEALRMYPPVPSGLPRVVPQGGASICGNFVPENTVVSIYHWAMYHNEEHFKNPFGYHPERWLNDPEFAGDHKDAFQPFHLGARNCLGRNLAYIEMRLILTRILWNFDMRVADDSLDWMSKQRIYNLWKKGPLNVYLTPRQ
ncbi:cytochrome P450 [Apodospora peruviana]|uniref:Cytochrome P450 n=1 Tax=Apodospora peruviana TaxID=516989 RepID=A0AAE0HUK9_9PEZI|nr:cytochrome P450 [Apodospora peruviana]